MSRIETLFKTLNRPALISFIMAGDPDYAKSMAALEALAEGGADIIELGMPFTDPVADGPTIQLAGQRALNAGASMDQTLRMARQFRQKNTKIPLVLMGYANPVFTYGYDAFCKDAKEAGVDGLIIVDLPPEESGALEEHTKAQGLDLIRLITPTTTEKRLQKLLKGASGFVYYVSIAGITGAAKATVDSLRPQVNMVRKHTKLPIAVGFGIRTPADVQDFAQIADAVVVGSAIVQTLADHVTKPQPEQAVRNLVSQLSEVLKTPRRASA